MSDLTPHRWPTTHPLHFSAYPFDCLLAVAKQDFCTSEATGKQVLCRLKSEFRLLKALKTPRLGYLILGFSEFSEFCKPLQRKLLISQDGFKQLGLNFMIFNDGNVVYNKNYKYDMIQFQDFCPTQHVLKLPKMYITLNLN